MNESEGPGPGELGLFLNEKSKGFEALAQSPEVKSVIEKLDAQEISRQHLYRLALQELAHHDPQVRVKLEDLDLLAATSSSLADKIKANLGNGSGNHYLRRHPDIDPQLLVTERAVLSISDSTAEEVLTRDTAHRTGLQTHRPLESIVHALDKKEYPVALRLAEKIKSQSEDPLVLWRQVVQDGQVGPEFEATFDQMTDLIKISQMSLLVQESSLSDQDKKTVLAHEIKSRFEAKVGSEDGLNPVLIEEIVNGNFGFDQNYMEAILDGYLGLVTETEQQSKSGKASARKKAMVAVFCGMLLFSADQAIHPIKPPGVVQTKNPETGSGKSQKKRAENFSNQPNNQKQRAEHPENDDIDLEKASKAVIWKIETANPLFPADGYFKEETAELFDSRNKEWVVDNNDLQDPNLSQTDGLVEYTLKANLMTGNTILIPVREEEMPFGRKTVIRDLNGKPVEFIYTTNNDGTFTINLLKDPKMGVSVEIGIGSQNSAGYSTSERPNSFNQNRVLARKDLPEDGQKLFDEVKDLPDMEKAAKIQEYFKNNYIYSQDGQWSDFYDDSSNVWEYYHKFFDVRRGDCDVINGVMAEVMRTAGLSTKMGIGYIHSGFLKFADNNITAAEAHGYVRVFNEKTGKWKIFDGTPSQMDDFTMDKFSKAHGEGETLPSIGSLEDLLNQLKKEGMMAMYGLRNFGWQNEGSSGILIPLLEGALAIAAYSKISSVTHNKIRRMEQIFNQLAQRMAAKNPKQVQPITTPGISELVRSLTKYGKRKTDQGLSLVRPDFYINLVRKVKAVQKTQEFMAANPEDDSFSMLDYLEEATGISEAEIEREITRRNKNPVVQGLRDQIEESAHPLMVRPEYGMGDFVAEYRRLVDPTFNYLPPDALLWGDKVRKIASPEEYLDRYYQYCYRQLRIQINVVAKEYRESLIKVPRPNFPSTFEAFRAGIPDTVDRQLIVFWALQHESL